MESSKTKRSLLYQKSLCVITGASRGIGKEIAIRLSTNVAPNSTFVLLSRNRDDLMKTAEEITKANADAIIEIFTCDMSNLSEGEVKELKEKLTSILGAGPRFDVAMIIHNAGTLGDVSRPVWKFDDASEIREHLETNVVSYILLNNALLGVISGKEIENRVVINITSLLAIQAVPGYGIYGVGKAARESFAKTIAVENPGVRVLNYSPGPIKTDMTDYLQGATWSEEGRKWWKDATANGSVLTVEQTATKFLRILDENSFENGAHVDYYDIA